MSAYNYIIKKLETNLKRETESVYAKTIYGFYIMHGYDCIKYDNSFCR